MLEVMRNGAAGSLFAPNELQSFRLLLDPLLRTRKLLLAWAFRTIHIHPPSISRRYREGLEVGISRPVPPDLPKIHRRPDHHRCRHQEHHNLRFSRPAHRWRLIPLSL